MPLAPYHTSFYGTLSARVEAIDVTDDGTRKASKSAGSIRGDACKTNRVNLSVRYKKNIPIASVIGIRANSPGILPTYLF